MDIGSLGNNQDIETAVRYLNQGHPIVFQFRGVFGICINGADIEMVKRALKIKGDQSEHRPLSGMMLTETFLPLIDLTKVNPIIKNFFSNPNEFKDVISTLWHIRAPITTQAAGKVPYSMLSIEGNTTYLHNLDSHGHPVHNLVTALDESEIPYVAVTTLNRTKVEPEITTLEAALKFCTALDKSLQVPLILTDPLPLRKGVIGSFAIIDITARDDGRITGTREGHIPLALVQKALGVEIDLSKTKPSAFDQIDFSKFSVSNLSPTELRKSILDYLHTDD